MSSQINLEALTAAKLGYVTRLSAATLQTLVAELALEKQLELGDHPAAPGSQPPGQALRDCRGALAPATGSRAPPKPAGQGRAGVGAVGGGQTPESGRAKARQPGGPQSATAQGPQVFHLSRWTRMASCSGQRKEEFITQEAQQDGWYLLHTNEPCGALSWGTGAGALQRIAGCRGGLLRTQELSGSPPRASPSAGPGDQSCALVFSGLLVERAPGRGMARPRRDPRGAAHACATCKPFGWAACGWAKRSRAR